MTLHKLVWSSLALKDLLEIKDYIRRDKPSAAKQEAQGIKIAVERLARFPLSGRKLETMSTVRELVKGNYRIFYRVQASQVDILRIYHGKRNIQNLLIP